jgi:hypothetical protein
LIARELISERSTLSYRVSRAKIRFTFQAIVTKLHSPRTLTAQGRFQRIQVVTVEELLAGRPPRVPARLETDAFRQPLRAKRAARSAPPSAQLTLPLPIPGKKQKQSGVEDHLSGEVLAALSAS